MFTTMIKQCVSACAAVVGVLAIAGCTSQSHPPVVAPVPAPIAGASAPVSPHLPVRPVDSGVVTAMESPFFTMNRSDWPGPNSYRDATGAPGPDYWQQRADYAITATLDTAAKTLSGT